MSEDTDIVWSENNAAGKLNRLTCQTMKFPDGYWPVTVYGGSEQMVYRRKHQTSMNRALEPIGFWVFIGLERGDLVETEFNVEDRDGIPLVLTSWHKPETDQFDGWRWYPIDWYDGKVQGLNVIYSCRVTGENHYVPRDEPLTAVFHCGLRVIGRLV